MRRTNVFWQRSYARVNPEWFRPILDLSTSYITAWTVPLHSCSSILTTSVWFFFQGNLWDFLFPNIFLLSSQSYSGALKELDPILVQGKSYSHQLPVPTKHFHIPVAMVSHAYYRYQLWWQITSQAHQCQRCLEVLFKSETSSVTLCHATNSDQQAATCKLLPPGE